MYYITVMQSPSFHQMTLDEFLFNAFQQPMQQRDAAITGTRTYEVNRISDRFMHSLNVDALITALERFNAGTGNLRRRPREQLYHTFYIP